MDGGTESLSLSRLWYRSSHHAHPDGIGQCQWHEEACEGEPQDAGAQHGLAPEAVRQGSPDQLRGCEGVEGWWW